MKKLLSLLLLLCLLLPLSACGKSAAPAAETPALNVMVLNGTTGLGMAQLMDANAKGESALHYRFTVETDAANITAALINGTCDLAALPTNAAAALYQRSDGAVQCLAVNTRGVLYVVTTEADIHSFADLDGKTVYSPAQNPYLILSALSRSFAMISAKGSFAPEIDTGYAQPADLMTAVSSGAVTLAVLPEPLVTVACSKNPDLRVALDLTAVWDSLFPAGSLVQGCIVVRRGFAEANADALPAFLAEYAASVDFLTEHPDAAAEMTVSAGILSSAAAAKQAIPRCNVCCLTGEEMQSAMDGFLRVMYDTAPDSVGGALPGEDFYCLLPHDDTQN